ncbi:MAG: hypothetical protein V1720_17045 [bacterium]
METAIVNSSSKTDLKLLLDIAKKIGIKVKVLSESEMEDIGMLYAIKNGRTGKFVDTKSFIKKLRK